MWLRLHLKFCETLLLDTLRDIPLNTILPLKVSQVQVCNPHDSKIRNLTHKLLVPSLVILIVCFCTSLYQLMRMTLFCRAKEMRVKLSSTSIVNQDCMVKRGFSFLFLYTHLHMRGRSLEIICRFEEKSVTYLILLGSFPIGSIDCLKWII